MVGLPQVLRPKGFAQSGSTCAVLSCLECASSPGDIGSFALVRDGRRSRAKSLKQTPRPSSTHKRKQQIPYEMQYNAQVC